MPRDRTAGRGRVGPTRRALLRSGSAAAAAGLAGCASFRGGGEAGAVVVGAAVPETGSVSGLGQELRQGYELGVKHVNESEEYDLEFDLRLADDGSEPESVGQELGRLVAEEDLTMAWGSVTTPLVMAGSAVAEREGVPFLGVGFAYERPHRENDLSWTFVPYPKTRHIVDASTRVLEDVPSGRRPARVGIWEPNSGWGREMADAWESAFSSAGYEVVLRERFSFGTQDFSTLIGMAAEREVEVLLSNPIPPDGITAVNQMKASGYAPKLMEFVRAAHSNGWWRALGADGNYALTSPGWVPGLAGNGNERFRTGYDAEYGTGDTTTPVTVGGAYNLVQVAAQAVSAADSTAPEDVRSALLEETFRTVVGEFGLGDDGMLAGEFAGPTGQWWRGEQRLVFPSNDGDLAMDLRYPMEPWGDR